MKTLTDRKCVVTGAASGIGRATALAAGRAGARLLLTDINADGLAETVALATEQGSVVLDSRRIDLTDNEAVLSWAEAVHTEFGSVDVVMNIAGISAWGTVENLQHRHWKAMVDVNLMGPINVIEGFLPEMVRAGRGGQLVNVSSAAGLLALPWHAAYSASKFGLRGVSEVLRFDLARHRIGVSLVVPGAVRTPLMNTVEIVGLDRTDPAVERLIGMFGRHAVSPEHVATCILRGIRRNTFVVYTSPDIRVGYFFARVFPWPYEFTMRQANNLFARLLERQQKAAAAKDAVTT